VDNTLQLMLLIQTAFVNNNKWIVKKAASLAHYIHVRHHSIWTHVKNRPAQHLPCITCSVC